MHNQTTPKTPQIGWLEQRRANMSRSPSSVQTTSHNPCTAKPRPAGMPGRLLMQRILPGGDLAPLPAWLGRGGEWGGGLEPQHCHGRLRQPGPGRRGRGCICCIGRKGGKGERKNLLVCLLLLSHQLSNVHHDIRICCCSPGR